MSRKLAYIVKIASCEPIPDTERLSVATMEGNGWNVVVGRDEFSKGEYAIFFEIDSALNPNDERFAFLKDRCLRKFVTKSGQVLREVIRIKTVKLRGVVSQGLLMRIQKFPEITQYLVRTGTPKSEGGNGAFWNVEIPIDWGNGRVFGYNSYALNGFDVTEFLHVEHFDELKEQYAPACGSNPIAADALGTFPTKFIPKTDEDRLTNHTDFFETMKGRKFQITEKADGSSCTVFYSPTIDAENPYGVCSRNLRLKEVDNNGNESLMHKVAKKYNLEQILRNHFNETGEELAIQAELVGPGVNSNRDKFPDWEIRAFYVWNITKQEYYNPNCAYEFCKKHDIPHVKVIDTDIPFFDRINNLKDALSFADGKTDRGNLREGVVLKSTDEMQRVSFKIISNKYLLKEED